MNWCDNFWPPIPILEKHVELDHLEGRKILQWGHLIYSRDMCPLGLISSNFSIFSNDWWFIASLVVWIRDFLGTLCKSQLLDASTSISSNEITMSVVKFPISSGDCAKNEPSGACPLGVVPTGAAWNDGWFSYDIRVYDWFWLVPTYHSPFFLHMFDGLYVGNHPHLWWRMMTNYAIFMGGNLECPDPWNMTIFVIFGASNW